MTTFVVSEQPSSWHVHRFADTITEISSSMTNEEAAVSLALKKGMEDRPSQVLKISLNGDSRVIARFDKEEKSSDKDWWTALLNSRNSKGYGHIPGLF
jgi:hypothetical protein